MSVDQPGVCDIFRRAGDAFATAWGHALHHGAWRVFNAICQCRTAALGARHYHCPNCDCRHVLYNSCRNRHCSSCQGAAAKKWLLKQSAKVLPAPCFHLVFTLPKQCADIAFANRQVVFNILFRTSAETLITIGADPKRLGAHIGVTAVLHTWNQRLEFHPHIHAVVANGGFDVGTGRWKVGSKRYFAPVKVLGRLFRRRFLEELEKAHRRGQLKFPGKLSRLQHPEAFRSLIADAQKKDWVVYAKAPFAGPRALLSYLSRYTHRVAISDSRIQSFDGQRVTFRCRKPRRSAHSRTEYGSMTLSATEFIRRFMMHVLPNRFHRIRHFGILANSKCRQTLERVRRHTGDDQTMAERSDESAVTSTLPACPDCQTPMLLLETVPAEMPYQLHSPARAPPSLQAA